MQVGCRWIAGQRHHTHGRDRFVGLGGVEPCGGLALEQLPNDAANFQIKSAEIEALGRGSDRYIFQLVLSYFDNHT